WQHAQSVPGPRHWGTGSPSQWRSSSGPVSWRSACGRWSPPARSSRRWPASSRTTSTSCRTSAPSR
ncbi:MAG: hypothetical protein AVDCRST_MAG77-194, partial [uncultured Chloroflexi bacterium]